MEFDRRSRTSVLGHAGLRASYAISGRSGVFVPQLRAEFQYEFEDEAETIASRLQLDSSGAEYRFAGDRLDRSGVAVGLGVVGVLPGGWSLFVDYEVLLGNDDTERQRATLGFRKEL
jgi:outer membrane autotransporter protein